MAKKRTTKTTTKPVNNVIDIDNEDDTIAFNIKDGDGKVLGLVDDTVGRLHRMALVAQQEQYENNPNEPPEDYTKLYAEKLSKRFNVKVSDSAAYRIATHVFEKFHAQKKT